MLTSGSYTGSPLAVHARLPLRPALFDRWLLLWNEAARELFTPPLAARFSEKAARIAESLQLGLFYRPEGLRIAPRSG